MRAIRWLTWRLKTMTDEDALVCPHCLEPIDEDTTVEGPRGNLWHSGCLDSWREDDD
jgi:hypothetical protein